MTLPLSYSRLLLPRRASCACAPRTYSCRALCWRHNMYDRNAKNASITHVAYRSLSSVNVCQASRPRATYTVNAKKNFCDNDIKNPGAQGRIRTSVARKERQIYSLLPLTTRPPVHEPIPGQPTQARCVRRDINPEDAKTPHAENRAQPYFRTARFRKLSLGDVLRRTAVACSWSWRRDSNPRPSDYKSDALPAELRQRTFSRLPGQRWKVSTTEFRLQAHSHSSKTAKSKALQNASATAECYDSGFLVIVSKHGFPRYREELQKW